MHRTQDAPAPDALQATMEPPDGSRSTSFDASASSASEEGPLVGELFDKWELQSLLGRGGMAQVYRAKHQWLALEAAVKVLDVPIQEHAAAARERFHKEAFVLSQFHHENIIQILDFGVSPGHGAFMALELLNGYELSHFMEQAPLPLSWVLEVFLQLCEALRVVHEAGFIHRDLKPSNVFVVPTFDGFTVKLLDFGVVKALHEESAQKLTSTGNIVGTPKYLSPEQIRTPDQVSPMTDVYALGVMMYEAIAGRPPFASDDLMDHLLMITQSSAPLIGSIRPAFQGTQFEALLAEMLLKEPGMRPSSVAQLGRRIHSLRKEVADPVDSPERRLQIEKKLQMAMDLASGEFVLNEQPLVFGRPRVHASAPSGDAVPSRTRSGRASRPRSSPSTKPPPPELREAALAATAEPSQETARVESDAPTETRGAIGRWLGAVFLLCCVCFAVLAGRWFRNTQLNTKPKARPAVRVSSLEALAARGRAAFKEEKYDRALVLWKRVTSRAGWRDSSLFPKLYRVMGVAHMRAKQHQRALPLLLQYKKSVLAMQQSTKPADRARLPSAKQFASELREIRALRLLLKDDSARRARANQRQKERLGKIQALLLRGRLTKAITLLRTSLAQKDGAERSEEKALLDKAKQLLRASQRLRAATRSARFVVVEKAWAALRKAATPAIAKADWMLRLKRQRARAGVGARLLQSARRDYQRKRWRAAHKSYTNVLKTFPKAWNRKLLRQRIKACRCVFGPFPWESCTKKDFPKHFRKAR